MNAPPPECPTRPYGGATSNFASNRRSRVTTCAGVGGGESHADRPVPARSYAMTAANCATVGNIRFHVSSGVAPPLSKTMTGWPGVLGEGLLREPARESHRVRRFLSNGHCLDACKQRSPKLSRRTVKNTGLLAARVTPVGMRHVHFDSTGHY